MKSENIPSWYYKLTCGHIRLLDRRKKPIENKLEVYCVHHDQMSTVVERAERF